MAEKIENPPEEKDKGKEKTPKDTGAEKSVEERLKEAEEKSEKLQKQLDDKEVFIGKQSTEIGELRSFKSEHQELIEKAEQAKGEKKDELVQELSEELVKDGMSKEDAEFNAKILAKGTTAVIERRESKRMQSEVVDMIEDAIEDGKIDKEIYDDNKAEINAEFRKRRIAPTARKNFRIYKECYNLVVKQKADAMKKKESEKDEEQRRKLIGEGEQPPPGQKTAKQADEEKKVTDAIKNASVDRGSSAFF